ncbi:tetratricopeptide repeat protein [Thermodesulfobacteriota bacterium]
MRNKIFLVFFIVMFSLTGCGVNMKPLIKGEYYLSMEKYQDGIRSLQKDLIENPNDPNIHYFLGRFHLAEKNSKAALIHLKKAVEFSPRKAGYHFWLGIAYSANKQSNMEKKSYEKALELNPKHLESRIYLAHTQMERKQYKEALANYSNVLKNWEDEPASLYNKALALNKLNRKKEETAAWKEYLDFYPAGPMARNAADHLNSLGDLSYRNYLIGLRTITLRNIRFEPLSDELIWGSKKSLYFLGEILSKVDKVSIHIIAYQKNNKQLAEQRAKSIKKYLLESFPQMASSRLKVSWFDVPEKIQAGGKTVQKNESINFITVAK